VTIPADQVANFPLPATNGRGPAADTAAPRAAAPIYELLDVAGIAQIPPPSWLVEGMIPASAFSVLYGPSNAGKSFLGLDFALCIATGLPWWGRETEQGTVVYIAAEGVGGLAHRNAAWQIERALALGEPDGLDRLRFLPEAPNLLDHGDVDRVRRTLEPITDLKAIVIDTMARCMIGGDENSARDVGVFVNAVDTIRADHGAAGLVVHHTGKDGENERGSSALRGAADAMMKLVPDGASLRLECDKAKDAAKFDPWSLHLAEVGESCVIRVGSDTERLSDQEERVLRSLPEAFGSSPATTAKLLVASGVPERTFYRAVQSLTQRGLLDCEPQGRSKLYSLSDTGQRHIGANDCQTTATEGDYCQAVTGPLPVGEGPTGSNRWADEVWVDDE